MTPTAVSHQIQRLEGFLGVKLFVRLNRSVALTDLGRDLAIRLQEVFARIDDALAVASEPRRSPLQVSAMPSLAAKWLAPRLHRFEAQHPRWPVRLVAADHLVNFANEDVDVCVRYGSGSYRGVHVESLMTADAFPVCSPGLLVPGKRALRKPADLRHHTLLHDETSRSATGIPDWHDWLRGAGAPQVKADRGPVFGSIHLALEAAVAGHGVALGLSPLVVGDLANGRLIRPFGFQLRSSYAFWVVCPRARAQMPKIKAFRGWLASEARQTTSQTLALAAS